MDITTLTCPVCPHCGVEKVSFQLIYQVQKDHYSQIYYQLWRCGNCSNPACSVSEIQIYSGRNTIQKLLAFYPLPREITAPHATPEAIANTFRSAKRYLLSGRDADFEAACIMARRGIEQAVNAFGGEGKNLFQKINNLESKRLIPPAMRDWAHHLRDIGNEGAHGEAVTKEDAEQAVYFAEMLFTYLYSLPAKMEEYRQTEAEHTAPIKSPS